MGGIELLDQQIIYFFCLNILINICLKNSRMFYNEESDRIKIVRGMHFA